MIRTTLLSLTLIACNSFDAQQNADEPTAPSYKIVDASDSIDVNPDLNDFSTPKSVVMTIPELGLEVIEQETEIDTHPDSTHSGILDYEEAEQNDESLDDAVDDEIVTFIQLQHLKVESPLYEKLTAEKPAKFLAIGTFPKANLVESKTEHELIILLPNEKTAYTSEVLESIVVGVQSQIQSIYIPLTAESMPDILFNGIEFAQSKGVRVYDVNGFPF